MNKNLPNPTYFTAINVFIKYPISSGVKIENYPDFTFENLTIISILINLNFF